MLVVLFHLGVAISADKYFGIAAFSVPFSFGNSGVEFFFVLSGFIILFAHKKDISKPTCLISYLKKRLIRIYPTYWIIFLSVFFLALVSPALRNTVPHDVFIILKSLFLVPQDSTVVGGTGAPVLIVAWTLQYEIFFYLFFATIIINKWLGIGLGFTLLYLYMSNTGHEALSFPLSFILSDYIWLFIMGMIVAAFCSYNNVKQQRPIFYMGVGVTLFLIISADKVIGNDLFLGWKTLLYGLASSIIVLGFVQAENKGQVVLGNKWLQILGDSSYALYLIHYPLISILCKFSMLIHLDSLGVVGAMIAYIVILIACLASSIIFHLWIEKPLISYLRTYNTNRLGDCPQKNSLRSMMMTKIRK